MGRVSIKMPQLGESVTEGTVERWLKKEGDSVVRDEPLVEVVTDKVNAEIPSPFAGRLVHIDVTEGQTVAIGASIAQMEIEDVGDLPTVLASAAEQSLSTEELSTGESVLITPALRSLADERGVELSAVTGTGARGRITRGDVLAAAATGQRM